MTLSQQGQVLIHAPFGRDAELIQRVLAHAQIGSEICATLPELEAALDRADAAILGDEALQAKPVVETLAARLSQQPPWSDIPLLMMTSGGTETGSSRQRLQLIAPLGNVMLLERPLRIPTLVSAVKGALRARQHQYQIRDLLVQRERDVHAIELSNEELRRLNAELQQFAYSASHDLREPLRVISLYCEVIKKQFGGQLGPAGDQFIKYMVESVRRMEQLLTDLLNYTRSTAVGEDPAALVDANIPLQRALTNLGPDIEQSGITIATDAMPQVRVHEFHLEQLFQNLIGNAIKYRSPKNPTADIRVKQEGDFWLFSIADNGIGIDPQYADIIFGLFKRLHQKEEYSGTGIGLAICKRIVERYGGRIWVDSDLGKGAIFYFTLPH
ncbi:MAG TPA: ATP-binding protein [Bryobacteraceae bacterium]|nr:ATP-binding protein [Bryobacteraceae bacterium]